MNKYDKKYIDVSDGLEKQMDDLYDDLIKSLSGTLAGIKTEEYFLFKKNKALSKLVDEQIYKLRINLTLLIKDTTKTVWDIANNKNDEIAGKIKNAPKAYTMRNEEALKSFTNQKTAKFTYSERVWRNTETLKQELEEAINAALKRGQSAASLSRDIKKYLNYPDMRFRKIHNKEGNLVLSQQAKAFHPGKGVYRSSYQNALRLSRNEINKAYRKADWLRWQQMDMVVGYKIIPSPRSATVCPICQRLQGVYPKWFSFTGWHVSCRCTAVAILCSDEEFNKLQKHVLGLGDKPELRQPPLPAKFTSYYNENKPKIERLEPVKRPDWVADNLRKLRFV